MTSPTWTERYNCLRFFVLIIGITLGALFWGFIGLLIVGALLS